MSVAVFTCEPNKQVDSFCHKLTLEAENAVAKLFPQKVEDLQKLLSTSFSREDLASLKAPLDIPMPDPEKEEAKRQKKKEEEKKKKKKKNEDEDEDKDDEDAGPPCGPIWSNQVLEVLLNRVDLEIHIMKEMLNLVSSWLQLHIPQIQDGNNFGVAVQEKVFETLTNTRTRVDGFQTQIVKFHSDRGDAVNKASKQPHVGDFRQLVHELDQYQFLELRLVVLDLRNTYAALFDVVDKNYNKIKKPRGAGKALIY